MLHEIHSTETCSLRTENRAAPSHSLACKDTCIVLLSKLLVHSVHIADLSSADSYVTCRNVLVRTYHLPELEHESLAEAHDLSV